MRAVTIAASVAAVVVLPCAPVAAQQPAEPLQLFPSWSEQVDALYERPSSLRQALIPLLSARWAFLEIPSLRRGSMHAGAIRGTSHDAPGRGSACAAAGAIGFTLGLVGELAWSDPLGKLIEGMPASRIQTPLGNRHLYDVGAIAGRALVCSE